MLGMPQLQIPMRAKSRTTGLGPCKHDTRKQDLASIVHTPLQVRWNHDSSPAEGTCVTRKRRPEYSSGSTFWALAS